MGNSTWGINTKTQTEKPSNWKRIALGEVSEVVSKGTTPTTLGYEFCSVGIPFLRAEDVNEGAVNPKEVAFHISSKTHELLSRSQLQPGDLLITIAGTLGRVGYVPSNAPALNCNQAVAFARLKPNLIDIKFASLICQSPDVMAPLLELKKVGTIGNLNLEQVRGLEIPLPPLAEQKRIAAILDKAAWLRRQRLYALELSKAFLQAVFLKMFGDPLTNPKGWKMEALGNLLCIPAHIGTTIPAQESGKQLCVRVGEVGEWYVDLDACKYVSLSGRELQRFSLLLGDIVLARAIGSESHLGKLSILGNCSMPVVFDSHLMRLRPKDTVLSGLFFAQWLRTNGGSDKIPATST